MKLKKIVFWGTTGQAIVLSEFLTTEYELIALFDNNENANSPFPNTPVYFGFEGLQKWKSQQNLSEVYFVVAIGGHHGKDRIDIHKQMESHGLLPITSIHPSAVIAEDAYYETGCQILANATVCSRSKLGICTIINTSSSVDHECVLADGVHVGPGANLAGCVEVGENTFIGTGACVLPRVKIGKNAIIGAGSVVTSNIPDNVVAYGNPCRIIRSTHPDAFLST